MDDKHLEPIIIASKRFVAYCHMALLNSIEKGITVKTYPQTGPLMRQVLNTSLEYLGTPVMLSADNQITDEQFDRYLKETEIIELIYLTIDYLFPDDKEKTDTVKSLIETLIKDRKSSDLPQIIGGKALNFTLGRAEIFEPQTTDHLTN